MTTNAHEIATTRTVLPAVSAHYIVPCSLVDRICPPVTLRPVQGAPASAAAAAREMLRLASGQPIAHLVRSFEKAGGIVITIPSLPGREAFAVWANDRPIVGIVPTSAGDRLRFGVAHEIGHLLMHVGPTSRRQAEQDAHRFAAQLLMPEAPVRYEMGLDIDLEKLAKLKLKWGVSMNALLMRARELKVISRRQFEAIIKKIAERGWRIREPESLDLPLERPRALRQMAEQIYGADLDFEEISKDYNLPVSFVQSVMEGCTSYRETTTAGRTSATVVDIGTFVTQGRIGTGPGI